jgi:hypothetical protein
MWNIWHYLGNIWHHLRNIAHHSGNINARISPFTAASPPPPPLEDQSGDPDVGHLATVREHRGFVKGTFGIVWGTSGIIQGTFGINARISNFIAASPPPAPL